jgi:hypothetical protein
MPIALAAGMYVALLGTRAKRRSFSSLFVVACRGVPGGQPIFLKGVHMQAIDSMLRLPLLPKPFSPAFLEILRFCSQVQDPSPHDIKALTAVYRCLRKNLDGREKIYAAKILGLMRLKSH